MDLIDKYRALIHYYQGHNPKKCKVRLLLGINKATEDKIIKALVKSGKIEIINEKIYSNFPREDMKLFDELIKTTTLNINTLP